jgi:hypothetical protein
MLDPRLDQMVFGGVINPTDPDVEIPPDGCDRVLEAEHIPIAQLGPATIAGSPRSAATPLRPRAAAFATIRARVDGTVLAGQRIKDQQ